MKTKADTQGTILIGPLLTDVFLFVRTDEFRQSLNVSVTVTSPSPKSNPSSYIRQRTIHCQKQVRRCPLDYHAEGFGR